jgi:hypothetical protein
MGLITWSWWYRMLAKKKAKKSIEKKNEILEHLEKQEEKLFELFNYVLKNHNFISSTREGDREIANGTISILMTDSNNPDNTYICVKKPDATFLEFHISNKKTKLLKDEFDHAIKRKSVRHQIEKRKGVEKHLDDLLDYERSRAA